MNKTEKTYYFPCLLFGRMKNSSNTHTHTHTHPIARNLLKYFRYTSSYHFNYSAVQGIYFPYTLLYIRVFPFAFYADGIKRHVPDCYLPSGSRREGQDCSTLFKYICHGNL